MLTLFAGVACACCFGTATWGVSSFTVPQRLKTLDNNLRRYLDPSTAPFVALFYPFHSRQTGPHWSFWNKSLSGFREIDISCFCHSVQGEQYLKGATRRPFVFYFQTKTSQLPPNHLLLDRSPNIGPLISRWELDKFKNCWNKSFGASKFPRLLYQQLSNFLTTKRDISGPRLGALSNNRWSGAPRITVLFFCSFYFVLTEMGAC